MDRVENCISFIIGKAVQQVNRRSRELLAPFGVTPVQYAVLKCLDGSGGMSGAELGARMVLDAASITGIVDRLQALKLVERRANPADRRAQAINATAHARAMMAELDAAMDMLNAEAAAILEGEKDTFLDNLRNLGQEKKWRTDV